MKNTIDVYVDGSCVMQGDFRGVGGCAYYIKSKLFENEGTYSVENTTNNLMEIEAVIKALTQLKEIQHIYNEPQKVTIYTDSDLIVNVMNPETEWKQKRNLDKWNIVHDLIKSLEHKFDFEFKWVKSQHKSKETDKISSGNKRADCLATKAKDQLKEHLVYMETIRQKMENCICEQV